MQKLLPRSKCMNENKITTEGETLHYTYLHLQLTLTLCEIKTHVYDLMKQPNVLINWIFTLSHIIYRKYDFITTQRRKHFGSVVFFKAVFGYKIIAKISVTNDT